MDDADEPSEQWAARRAEHRRPVGERKAITRGTGPQRAAHVGRHRTP
ncbi:DUF6087 family protein [Streptomyces sp. NPDC015171]